MKGTKSPLLCSFVLLLLFAASLYGEEEAPSVLTQANSPGWITVSWEHTGEDVYFFVIERQDPPYEQTSTFLVAQSNNRTDSLTDKNLKADTLYKYHVCAVYAYSRTCSDWVSVRTLPAPPPSPGGTVTQPTHPEIRMPELTATATDAFFITLSWNTDQINQVKNVFLYRNDQLICDAIKSKELFDGGCLYERRDIVPRANTKYKYKVCFLSFYGDTKCSEEITASGKPAAPTALANVTVSVEKVHGNPGDFAAQIKTLITARWRNTEITGEVITLEREDQVQLDRIRVGPAWVEIKQISAAPNPTELTVDTTPEKAEFLNQQGNNYRVCAIVSSLGPAGKVCSPAALASEPIKAQGRVPSTETGPKQFRSICEFAQIARDRNSPATAGLEEKCEVVKKGQAHANADPLATELRNQQPDDAARQGFDIGMATAEGQTLPGPGKDKACDSLSTAAEQSGCHIAVLFSVDRNRNAALASTGAAIAAADAIVANPRNADNNVFYRLGFDIATGLFGDPALGAKGNTEKGPGSLGIRDSLSPDGQRGFNASMELHLSRNYKN